MPRLTTTRRTFHELITDVQSDRIHGDIFYLRLKAIEHSLVTLLAESTADDYEGLRKMAREIRGTVVETD